MHLSRNNEGNLVRNDHWPFLGKILSSIFLYLLFVLLFRLRFSINHSSVMVVVLVHRRTKPPMHTPTIIMKWFIHYFNDIRVLRVVPSFFLASGFRRIRSWSQHKILDIHLGLMKQFTCSLPTHVLARNSSWLYSMRLLL